MTREKRGDKFGNKDRNKARPQNERPSTRGTSALETKKTRSQDFKREQKRTQFEGCELNDHYDA